MSCHENGAGTVVARIKSQAAARGIDAFGMCSLEDLRKEHGALLAEVPDLFTAALVFGIPVPEGCLVDVIDRPTPLYFHHYRQLNYILDQFAAQTAIALERAGAVAAAVPASQVTAWQPVPRGWVSHKLLAAAAGLGWWGRNNLLITERHGARIRLASVLTDLPAGAAVPPLESRCGSCRACRRACPAGAIGEEPSSFDAGACSEKLGEFQRLPFISQRICGVCVKACRPGLAGR